jgi:hypothetical protein
MHWVGHASATSWPSGVQVQGSYAYLTSGGYSDGAFQVYSLLDLRNPVRVARLLTPGNPLSDVEILGTHAYVGGSQGFMVVDVADPFSPVIRAIIPGACTDVAIAGVLAYVAGTTGLRVIDVSDASAPVQVGELAMPSLVALAVAGSHAYVGDWQGILSVVDVHDPTTPAVVSTLAFPNGIMAITVAGHHAYVAGDSAGLYAVDISDPTHPELAGQGNVPSGRDVDVAGNIAFYTSDRGLYALDISDPGSPSFPIMAQVNRSGTALALSGDHGILAGGGLDVIQILPARTAEPVGTMATPGHAYGIAARSGLAYLACDDAGLQVADLTDPTHPHILGSAVTTSALQVALSDHHAFVANSPAGMVVIDVADPTSPRAVSSIFTGYGTEDVAVTGTLALIARSDGLLVIDITDPPQPAIIGSASTVGWARQVEAAGNIAYVAALNLEVMDLSDPTSPRLLRRFALPTNPVAVALSDHLLYVSEAASAFWILDVSDPAQPVPLGSMPTPGTVRGIAIKDDIAYAACSETGLLVIDVSNPTAPAILGEAPGYGLDVALASGVIAVASQHLGLHVFPPQCGRVTPVELTGLEAQPGKGEIRIYAQLNPAPFHELQVTRAIGEVPDPRSYIPIARRPWLPDVRPIEIVDRDVTPGTTYAYTVEGHGLDGTIARFGPVFATLEPDAAAPDLRAAFVIARPNPTSGSLMLEFAVPLGGPISLNVYDPSGRLVRRLLHGTVDAGRQSAGWDGRDGQGRAVATGTYVVRLTANRLSASRSVTLIR